MKAKRRGTILSAIVKKSNLLNTYSFGFLLGHNQRCKYIGGVEKFRTKSMYGREKSNCGMKCLRALYALVYWYSISLQILTSVRDAKDHCRTSFLELSLTVADPSVII